MNPDELLTLETRLAELAKPLPVPPGFVIPLSHTQAAAWRLEAGRNVPLRP